MVQLASYASHNHATKGRVHVEQEDTRRGPYQRDRDRIIHCSAFRRLEYKTQVFVNHEGDLFRTRLTHSLEVAQIGRAIARNLALNEDLVEAIALAHDLGHTPFGHAGQDALNACMQEFAPETGGFEHNLQSLRIVDELEERYASFNGLNLCFETRAGILKHCSARNARLLGEVAQRFLDKQQPSLEAQITNFADGIAYNNHDIDDGIRSGLLSLEQMREVPIFNEHYESVMWLHPETKGRRVISETIRRMINTLIVDLIQMTQANIQKYDIRSIEDVHNAPMLVSFSPSIQEQEEELRRFLMKNLYRHYKVMRMSGKATMIIRDLFKAFLDDPRLLPTDYQREDIIEQQRAIADYIAGMTDRFAMREHRNLFAV